MFANLDGYQNELSGGGDFFGEKYIMWTHGWPLVCLVREPRYPLSGIYKQNPRGWTGPTGDFSRWPFDKAPISDFWLKPFLVDVSFFLFVVLGTAISSAWLDRKFKRDKSFSLKGLFLLTTVAAALCAITIKCLMGGSPQRFFEQAFAASVPLSTKLRYVSQLSAMAVIALGIALTVAGCFQIVLLNWRRVAVADRRVDEHASPN